MDEADAPAPAWSVPWHYGPTSTDADPSKMWHFTCGGEVTRIDEGTRCQRCWSQWDSELNPVPPGEGKQTDVGEAFAWALSRIWPGIPSASG